MLSVLIILQQLSLQLVLVMLLIDSGRSRAMLMKWTYIPLTWETDIGLDFSCQDIANTLPQLSQLMILDPLLIILPVT